MQMCNWNKDQQGIMGKSTASQSVPTEKSLVLTGPDNFSAKSSIALLSNIKAQQPFKLRKHI